MTKGLSFSLNVIGGGVVEPQVSLVLVTGLDCHFAVSVGDLTLPGFRLSVGVYVGVRAPIP